MSLYYNCAIVMCLLCDTVILLKCAVRDFMCVICHVKCLFCDTDDNTDGRTTPDNGNENDNNDYNDDNDNSIYTYLLHICMVHT